jgi:hypothetical protein
MSATTFQAVLKPNGSHSTSTLSGSTTTFQLPLRPAAAEGAQLTVRLKRKGGDPLLMVRFGTEPPSVPRRGKIVADAWDQEAFDAERAEHSVTVALPTGCDILCVGVCNYSAHRRETCYYTVTTTLHVPAPPPPPVSEAPATLRPSGLRPPSMTPAARLFATSAGGSGQPDAESRRVSFHTGGGGSHASGATAPHSSLGVVTPRRGDATPRAGRDGMMHPLLAYTAEAYEAACVSSSTVVQRDVHREPIAPLPPNAMIQRGIGYGGGGGGSSATQRDRPERGPAHASYAAEVLASQFPTATSIPAPPLTPMGPERELRLELHARLSELERARTEAARLEQLTLSAEEQREVPLRASDRHGSPLVASNCLWSPLIASDRCYWIRC